MNSLKYFNAESFDIFDNSRISNTSSPGYHLSSIENGKPLLELDSFAHSLLIKSINVIFQLFLCCALSIQYTLNSFNLISKKSLLIFVISIMSKLSFEGIQSCEILEKVLFDVGFLTS